MQALGKPYTAVIYPGAGHGFIRAGEQPGPTAANQSARDQALARLRQILKP